MDMSFRDIFTSSFLSHVNAVTGWDMGITLLLSLCMGLFILFIYTLVYEKALYSVSFGVTLVGLSMITATLILAVSSNVTLSLGMVGALSIVRFRTAIKDPLEIVFLFWSIETGIVIASGLIPLAVVVNFMIGLVLWLLAKGKTGEPYILILKCDQKTMQQAEEFMVKNVEGIPVLKSVIPYLQSNVAENATDAKKFMAENADGTPILKSTTPDLWSNFVDDDLQVEDADGIPVLESVTLDHQSNIVSNKQRVVIEKVFEVTLKHPNVAFMSALATMDGVEKALLVTYNGAYTG